MERIGRDRGGKERGTYEGINERERERDDSMVAGRMAVDIKRKDEEESRTWMRLAGRSLPSLQLSFNNLWPCASGLGER